MDHVMLTKYVTAPVIIAVSGIKPMTAIELLLVCGISLLAMIVGWSLFILLFWLWGRRR